MFKVIDCLNKTQYLLISKPNEIARNSNITQLLCAFITVTLLHIAVPRGLLEQNKCI